MTTTTATDLLRAARELAPRVRELAEASEQERDMTPALVEALRAPGLWDATKPAALGGPELELPDFLRIIEELSRADGSTGWTYMIGATTGYLSAFFPEQTTRDLYARYPDLIAGGSIVPRGKAVRVEGGYRISGRFPFGSGIRHTQLMGCGCVVFDGEAPRLGPLGLPEAIMALLPTADYQILDTWHVSGLRGTGSTDFAIADAFVPEEYCMQAFVGRPQRPEALYQYPLISFLAAEVAPVGLGIARHAIEALGELAQAKTPTGQTSLLRERAAVQADLARAEALVRSARAFLYETAEETWAMTCAGEMLDERVRALVRLAATTAVLQSAQAVDLLYNAGGATSIYESSPLERCFRDVHALTQHVIVQQPTLETVGKVLLGVELGPALL
ncbi:MAG TPA: acyl-CoA dehydrogenase family protein [Dehalococcoidia bacterium]|nr:acyl-CoA dehydrogenase family protein [Dehalococcoidia bacterium]